MVIKALALRQQTFDCTRKIVHLDLGGTGQLRLRVRADKRIPKIRATVLEAQSRGEAFRENGTELRFYA